MLNAITPLRETITVYEGRNNTPTLLFLHGFGCSSDDFLAVASLLQNNFRVILPDLPGFGRHLVPDDPAYFTQDYLLQYLQQVTEQYCPDKFYLAGYSMGGRAALHYAVRRPEPLTGLILESTTPGLRTAEERAARVEQDKQLTEMIRSEGMDNFLNYWESMPLFAGLRRLPPERLAAYRAMKRGNTAAGLINSLLGFGTGTMEPLWDALPRVTAPVLIITGEADSKYTTIGKAMLGSLPTAEHIIVPGAGHNVHLEKPLEFVNLVLSFTQTGQP